MRAFAASAERYAALGAAVVPCGGTAGKRPLVRWRGLTRDGAAANIANWASKYPEANIGLVTGPASALTVVDVDDPALADSMERRCGSTPLMVRTPRGGTHFFYRSAGERTVTNLDRSRVDVRGVGGFIVAPPSVRPDGATYELVRGSLDLIPNLPAARPGSLPMAGDISKGARNETLWRLCMETARECETEAELLAHAEILNEARCNPSLEHGEVRQVVASAWSYERRGRNYVGRGGSGLVDVRDVDLLLSEPDALCLLAFLRKTHLGVGNKTFALVAEAMAEARTLPGWGRRRIKVATAALLSRGLLEMVRHGTGRGNPNLYTLPGLKGAPNDGFTPLKGSPDDCNKTNSVGDPLRVQGSAS